MTPLKIEALPNDVTRAQHGPGSVEFWFPRPDVAMGRYTGTPTAELYPPVIEAMTRRLRTERALHVFADLSAIDGFDSAFRERWTEWFRGHRAQVAGVHILFHSRLVAIGIALVGVALGGQVHTYSSREDFEKALRRGGR